MKDLEDMISFVKSNGFDIQGKMIDSSKLIFEEKVKMNCFYCGKYNMSWKCPPKLPQIDGKKMLAEFDNAAFVWVQIPIAKDNFAVVRKDSSILLHRALLECEKWLWDHNNSTALSFIGGSCKLCKNGCAPNRCANPYQSRSPVEALGINVVKSAELFGINIVFPPTEYMTRLGLLLW